MGHRLLVRLAVATVGGVLGLVAAAPALAADTTVPLTDDHKGTVAKEFPTQDCDRIFQVKGDDEDGWYFELGPFRLPPRPDEVGFSLSFADADGNPVAITPETVDDVGTSLDAVTQSNRTWKWQLWLVTPAGWTLLGGSVAVPADKLGSDPRFGLGHTCPGEPPATEEPTPPPTEEPTAPPSGEPTPPASEGPTPPASEQPTPPGEQPNTPGLPVTGMSVGGLLILSGGLLSAGIALVAVRRRRSLSSLLDT
ncbi:MAG: LPXTG cell wall anchor domain-containing protein [Micromonosporaceae bacterium]|jgi:LPXTG-motif cell wall-anchored protein